MEPSKEIVTPFNLGAFIEDLRHYSERNWIPWLIPENVGREGAIADIACGSAVPAIGMMKQLRSRGFNGKYFGTDIHSWQQGQHGDIHEQMEQVLTARNIKGLNPVLKEYWEKSRVDWLNFWKRDKGNIILDYGDRYDATKEEIWKEIEGGVGMTAATMIRQPDVNGFPDVFSRILGNMVSYSLSHETPLLITTSNRISLDEVYPMVEGAFTNGGARVNKSEDVWDEYRGDITKLGKDMVFSNGWQLKLQYLGDYVGSRDLPNRREDSFGLKIWKP